MLFNLSCDPIKRTTSTGTASAGVLGLEVKGRRHEQRQNFWSSKTRRSRKRKERGREMWDMRSSGRGMGWGSSRSSELAAEWMELERERGVLP